MPYARTLVPYNAEPGHRESNRQCEQRARFASFIGFGTAEFRDAETEQPQEGEQKRQCRHGVHAERGERNHPDPSDPPDRQPRAAGAKHDTGAPKHHVEHYWEPTTIGVMRDSESHNCQRQQWQGDGKAVRPELAPSTHNQAARGYRVDPANQQQNAARHEQRGHENHRSQCREPTEGSR